MEDNQITEIIIGCAIKVHRNLGPGLLESAYQECLLYELSKTRLYVEREKPQPLVYEDVHLNCGYRIDLMVENLVVIEIKAVEALNEVHLARMTDGIKRVINKWVD